MRTVDQVHRDTSPWMLDTWAAETTHASTSSGTAHGLSLAGQYEDFGSLTGLHPASDLHPASHGLASRNGSRPSRSEPAASRRPIGTATPWLVACIIKGFAAYAQGMYPSFAGRGEFIDREELERNSQPRRHADNGHGGEAPWLNASHSPTSGNSKRSARAQTASPGWSARITSPVARFWSSIRRALGARQRITQLEALDDRTLKDIGISRYQIERFETHRGR